MRRAMLLVCIGSLLLAGCARGPGGPKVVTYPTPPLSVKTDWLESASCTPRASGYGSAYRTWDCPPGSPLRDLGCEQVVTDYLLAGLAPAYPLAECHNYGGTLPDGTKFRHEGCLMSYMTAYVAFKDGAYRLVRGTADLQPLYAPVESPVEALSYALAATDLGAIYWDQEQIQQYSEYFHYLASRLEETHVEETQDGYVVHLFTSIEPSCGCGNHTVNSVDVLVSKDGQVSRAEPQPAYEFSACVD